MRTKRYASLVPLLALTSLLSPSSLAARAKTGIWPIEKTLGRSTTTTHIGKPLPLKSFVRAVTRASLDDILTGQAGRLPQFSALVSQSSNVKYRYGTPLGSLRGFAGLNSLDSATASGIISDPPDQGLAAGNGFLVEAVNSALAVYDKNGKMLEGPLDLNSFFSQLPEVTYDPVTQIPAYGPFLTDPRCYYDWPTKRWFATIAEVAVDSATGTTYTGQSAVLIAVSQSADPTGLWNLYFIDQSGSIPDQPLLGADKNGIYITTNNFPFDGSSEQTNLFVFSKQGLENGTVSSYYQFSNLGDGSISSVQPATTPPNCAFASENQGTEYFLSSLDFFRDGAPVNQIAIWSITNTASLNTASPTLTLSAVAIPTQEYSLPAYAVQKAGLTPFGASFGFTEEYLDGGDDRMQQVQYINGVLWAGLTTSLPAPPSALAAGPTAVSSDPFAPWAIDGIAYFAVHPIWNRGYLDGQMVHQGYVAAPNGNSVVYPAIAGNSRGKIVMSYTLTGPDYYPSAAFSVYAGNAFGSITVAAAGVAPDDSFSGYGDRGPYGLDGPQVTRWGDYAGAVSDTDGSIWLASDCILGPSTGYTNWCTFLTQLPR